MAYVDGDYGGMRGKRPGLVWWMVDGDDAQALVAARTAARAVALGAESLHQAPERFQAFPHTAPGPATIEGVYYKVLM